METDFLIGVISTALGVGFTAALGLVGVLYFKGHRDQQQWKEISFTTLHKYQKVRRAGEDSRVALRKFHGGKQTNRIEARRYWQAEYDALVAVPNGTNKFSTGSGLWFPYSCFPGMDDDLRIKADLINRRMMHEREEEI